MIEAIRRSQLVVTATIVFLIPVLFWRITVDPFDLMKGSFLWILGIPLAFLVAVVALHNRRFDVSRLLLYPAVAFSVAALATTASSTFWEVSLFGQSQRYTGLLTLVFGLVVAVSIAMASNSLLPEVALSAHTSAAVCVVVYGLMQELEIDPFAWSSSSFSKLVFSTLGNPNTATAWLGCTLPVLYSTFLARSKSAVWRRILFGAFLGICSFLIVSFQSFQGQIAVLFCFPVAVFWLKKYVSRVGEIFSVIVSLVMLLGVPQMSGGTHLMFVSMLLGILSGLLLGIEKLPVLGNLVKLRNFSRRGRIAVVAVVVGVLSLAATALRGRLAEGFSDGFLERGDFYRAGRDVWFDHLLFGTGLETFGFVFPEYRPASHAITLDNSRTSSVHNIFLGMFSNGGLILGIAYLALIGCTALAAWKVVRHEATRDFRMVGVVFGWLAFQVVSLVSVEHVALFLMNFVFMGLIFSRLPSTQVTSDRTGTGTSRKRKSRGSSRLRQSAVAILFLALPATIVGWIQTSRPMRAGIEGFEALQDFYGQSDPATVIDRLEKATQLAPWDATHWLRLAEVFAQGGDYQAAVPPARRAVETAFYVGPAAKSSALILFNSGAVNEAVDVMREALRRDPYSPGVTQTLVEVLIYAAQNAYSNGDLDTAKGFLKESRELLPGYAIEGLDELLQAVGVSN